MVVVGRLVAVLLVVEALPAPAAAEQPGGAGYAPYDDIPRGTGGTTALTLRIRNAGTADLTCAASLAHWYSAGLGQVAPGGTLEVALRRAPETGVLTLLNAHGDRMPLEAVRCGERGAPRTLQGRVGLRREAGPVPAVLDRSCAPGRDGRVTCRPADP